MKGRAGKDPLPHERTGGGADVPARLAALASSQMHAVLAVAAGGSPYVSLVAFALAPGGRGLLFATPRKTRKFRSLAANPRVALLVDTRSNSARDYLSAESLTVEGRAVVLRRGWRREELAESFCRRHPRLRDFVAAPATALVLVEILQAVHVGGFQEVSLWRPES